jgi:hypothetical protein
MRIEGDARSHKSRDGVGSVFGPASAGERYQRNVTRLDLYRLGAHALGPKALEIRVDGPILRRNGVPARLRPLSRVRGFAREQGPMERPLHCVERLCPCFWQIAREIPQESLLAQSSFIVIENDAGRRRRRRKLLGQGCVIFAGIRRSRSHIDNRRDVGMHAGVCDDHP